MAMYGFRRRMAVIHQEGMDLFSQTHPETAGPEQGSKFSERIGIFSHDFLKCTVYLASLPPSHARFTQKFYSTLASSSTLLEDFLDYHGAKNNKDWYLFRELTAGMRHISLASNFQKHISNRLRYYDLPDSADFESEGEATVRLLNQCLQKMAPMALILPLRAHFSASSITLTAISETWSGICAALSVAFMMAASRACFCSSVSFGSLNVAINTSNDAASSPTA